MLYIAENVPKNKSDFAFSKLLRIKITIVPSVKIPNLEMLNLVKFLSDQLKLKYPTHQW